MPKTDRSAVDANTEVREPRVLFYDIETTHNIVASFQLYERHGGLHIPHGNILQERYMVSVAWNWQGEKAIHAVSVLDDPKRYARNPHDDYHVVKTIHALLEQADTVVFHNGKAYDQKYVETRALAHGLRPLAPIPQIDTNLVAKRRFLFNSNALDYIARFLKVGVQKKKTEPGLWLKILAGGKDAPAAIREMVAYNKVDIVVLKKVFEKLQAFVPDHLNRQLFGDIGCPRCGSLSVQSRGYRRSITRTYQQYQCNGCGGWFRDVKNARPSTRQRVL